MKRHAKIASVLGVVAGVMLTASAWAQYYSSSPSLPPPAPYVGPPQPFTFEGTALTNAGIASIYLYNLVHTPGTSTGSGYSSGNYWDTFNSTLTGSATINLLVGGPIVGASLSAEGSTTVTVMGGYTPGAVGGPWTTSLSIQNWPAATVTWAGGQENIFLQCPAAPGQTTVTNWGAGYLIDSFFDVQPQISLDDSNWTTSDQSGDMTLVPEPSGLALLGLGVLCLAIKTRRGRKQATRDPLLGTAGYASPDSFRHAFKAHEGLSPEAWRAGQ